jgi:hypothetical protein
MPLIWCFLKFSSKTVISHFFLFPLTLTTLFPFIWWIEPSSVHWNPKSFVLLEKSEAGAFLFPLPLPPATCQLLLALLGFRHVPYPLLRFSFICGMLRMGTAAQWRWLWVTLWPGAHKSSNISPGPVDVAFAAHKGINQFFFSSDCYSKLPRSFLGFQSASLNALFFLLLFLVRYYDSQVPTLLITSNAGTWQQVATVLLIMSPGLGILL